ncbi:uncharacterized protein LOC116704168 isoform X3 [Etheostoma spectabile]|uniref:uncharacterized protein LOC116704168 isoform X3 n=1 Tax=Etheostoma spectabile TaxID=54343 RepID=UPI0013AF91C4|nr:uncharacterized protein LOC116704168 isoform X3 [Etheostoma spectabile]
MWISSSFLVAGLFLSTSALTPEECQPLVKPLPLIEPSMMYGRWITIAGYVDGEGFNAILKATESTWVNVTQSPSSPNVVVTHEKDKINGTCVDFAVNVTIDGNTGSGSRKESTLKDSDVERFKQQASCLGFSREPDFLYDPKNELCA